MERKPPRLTSFATPPDAAHDYDERSSSIWGTLSSITTHQVNLQVQVPGDGVEETDLIALRVNGRTIKTLTPHQARNLGILTS
jgi:hypothetical protein